MKTAVIFGVLLFAARLVSAAPEPASFTKEPDGFRDIRWGTEIEKCDDMVPDIYAFGRSIFNRKKENLKMGDSLLSGIDYHFHDGKFCAAVVFFAGNEDFRKIRDEVFRLYGKAPESQRGGYQYRWKGRDVEVFLSFKGMANVGRLIYVYTPLDRERIRETGEDLFSSYGVTDEAFNFHGR